MDQIPQGLWVGPKGPTDGAEGYSLGLCQTTDMLVSFVFTTKLKVEKVILINHEQYVLFQF